MKGPLGTEKFRAELALRAHPAFATHRELEGVFQASSEPEGPFITFQGTWKPDARALNLKNLRLYPQQLLAVP